MPYTKPPLACLKKSAARLVSDCIQEEERQANTEPGLLQKMTILLSKFSYELFDRRLLQATLVAILQEDFPGDDENKHQCLLGAYFFIRRKNMTAFAENPLLNVVNTHLGIDDANPLDATTEHCCLLRFKACFHWMNSAESGFVSAFKSQEEQIARHYYRGITQNQQSLSDAMDEQLSCLTKLLTPQYNKPALRRLLTASFSLVSDCQLEEDRRGQVKKTQLVKGFFSAGKAHLLVHSYQPFDAKLCEAVAYTVSNKIFFFPHQEDKQLNCLLGAYFYVRRQNKNLIGGNVLSVMVDEELNLNAENALDPQTEYDCLMLFKFCLNWMCGVDSPFRQALLKKDGPIEQTFIAELTAQKDTIDAGIEQIGNQLRATLDKSSDPGMLHLLTSHVH